MAHLMGDKAANIPAISFKYDIRGKQMTMYFDKVYLQVIYSMMENQIAAMIVDMMEIDFSQMPEGMERPEGMGGSNENPLVDTLLYQDALLALYESYMAEIADTNFTEAYMSQIGSETAEMIAPYVEKDATAFFTYDEFLVASSADATDPNSLVYFAVSMAESIDTLRAGVEPTFHSCSFVAAEQAE